MNLITLTPDYGEDLVYINPEQICQIREGRFGARIWLSDGIEFRCKESLNEVLEKISGDKKSKFKFKK